jgi:5-methylcytosine-specific restriction protein A
MRLQVLRRDRFLCARCGALASEVDHVVPCELGGRDDPANLRSLCSRCHAELHAGRGRRPM